MVLSFFKKGRSDAAKADGDDGGTPLAKRDVKKARPWFERARTVADTRNYDYAVECYISGLKHDLDNLNMHEALHEVAMKRKLAGGRPAGFTERYFGGGKTLVEKALHAELLWAKDPTNPQLMQALMERLVELDAQTEQLNLGEVAWWVGSLILESAGAQKKPTRAGYVRVMELFEAIGAYDKAIEACRRALHLADNSDPDLLRKLKDLQATDTMTKARYGESARESIRDVDKQRDLDQQDQIARTGSAQEELIARRRAEYEEDPQDVDRAQKLVTVLVESGKPEHEDEAIRILTELWQQTGQYRYKMRIGDIRIRRFGRELREMRDQLARKPDDEALRRKLQELARQQIQFELGEFKERVKNYPTDMALRFQLGRRLHAVRQYDEAIAEFQQARADPKHRAQALLYLGRCYALKDWLDESLDALREAIDTHTVSGDKLGLEMRYELMDTLEKSAGQNRNLEQAREAAKIASDILQTDINYRDIRQRLDRIRKLVNELEGGEAR